MPDCECLPKCPFFNDRMAQTPAMAQLLKKRYCLGDATGCARYIVFRAAGREAVPADLYPAEAERVPGILEAFRKGQAASPV